jgi:hypothetical protein
MTQLVGSACALCGGRISSVLGAEWCEACGAPIHARCKRPGTAGGCPACGADDATAVAHRRRVAEDATAKWRGLRSQHVGSGLRHLCSGVGLLAVGGASFVLPILNRDALSVVWYGAIIVGATQLFRGIAYLLRAARMRLPPPA